MTTLKEKLQDMTSVNIVLALNAGNHKLDRDETIYNIIEFNTVFENLYQTHTPLEMMQSMLKFDSGKNWFLVDDLGDFISMDRLELINHANFYPECF